MMAKKDFEIVAKTLKAHRNEHLQYNDLVRAFSNVFKREYPHFNSFKFYTQCEVEDYIAEIEKER